MTCKIKTVKGPFGRETTLLSKKWRIDLVEKNGHIHVKIKGPNGLRRQGLSAVKDGLTAFEAKATVLHFYRLARDYDKRVNRENWINYVNYAEIFGSCFE